jgi:short-subunit dehydrogenase
LATAPTPHKTALITGAFSGAVMALANHVAQDGYQLVLATRSITKNFQKD